MIASLAQETKTAIKATLDSETSLQAVCTTQSAGITAVLNTGNIKLPASLEIEGTWTGQCICGEPVAVNMTEMTFKCIYNNGSYSYVTPTYLPLVWSDDEGTQTVTFSYTENDITVTAELSATVVAILESIAVSGTWENVQYAGRAVDTTGLSVIATFNNGRTEDVTSSATVSPSEWSDTIGTQTVTFTYTYGGRTRTTSKDAEVVSVYQQVEYLEGTGAQYIDTGLLYFADFEISIRLKANVTNKALGVSASACMQRVSRSAPYWQFSYNSASFNSTVRITEKHTMKWKEDKIYADGTFLIDKEKPFTESPSMCLFSADGRNIFPNMIYYCKLWDSAGVLVRDFIPCYRKTDNVAGMYDLVSEQFFTNAGTGTFITGQEI